jgi:glycosyltransferase involved in cell wall biosynthesis
LYFTVVNLFSSGMEQKQKSVALIVSARNEESDIGSCLKSLLAQDYPDTTVILVDNNSTDRTTEIARELGVRVENKGPERSAQRNYGARVSKAEFACFLDADMIVPPNMVSECLALMEDGAVGAVVIPEESFGDGFWTQCKILERKCYPPGSFIEAARFFRQTVFEALGGFDEAMTGLEDLDLHQRCLARYKIGHSTTPLRHHEGHIRFFEQMRKKFYYGSRSPAYAKKHPAAFRQQGNPFRCYFLKEWKLLIKTPVLTVAMLFMKCCELAAGGLGVLAGLIRAR